MAYRYGHPATAINGVAGYIQTRYPDSWVTLDIKKNRNFSSVNKFMKEYRESKGSVPSKNEDKNAIYIQQDFKSFAEYCKLKLKEL